MLKSLYISQFFFIAFGVGVILFVTGFYLPVLFYLGQFSLVVLIILTLLDALLLFANKQAIYAERIIEPRLNLGDETTIQLTLKNTGNQPYKITVFDEPPMKCRPGIWLFMVL